MKPSNIMISSDGAVKLMDFGIARMAESETTVSGPVCGTPRYMAPEQVEGVRVDARADIYSVGLILYEMLTGHRIFRGEPRVPFEVPEIEAIVSKCLQEDRANRYQNASELARALPPMTPMTQIHPRHWRHWRLIVPALIVFGLLFYDFRPSSTSEIPIRQYTLQNGLRVILSEDHAAPTYSIAITYNAGSRNERPGQTGYAHLFEHMMFQGSENVGKGEHIALVANNGGNVNGNTTPDYTTFFETLPANQLDLGLFIEADRMRSLVIDQPNLDSQRATVEEERRQGAGNELYVKTQDAVFNLAFDNFAYKHPVIGSIEDLGRATVKDVADFFRMYYAPSNAVLSLVGDFDSDDAMARIEKYFGKMPAQSMPAEPDLSEAAQKSERRQQIDDPFAARERIDIAFKIPPGNSTDFAALDVLSDLLLSNGSDGRLYQRLIKESEVALDAAFILESRRGPSLARLAAIPRPGKSSAELERLFSEEISRIQTGGVTPAELDRVRRQRRRLLAQRYKSTVKRAQDIARFAVVFGDPGLINTYEEKYGRVSSDDVRRVAGTYFSDSNRTVVVTTPKSRTEAPLQRGTAAREARAREGEASKDGGRGPLAPVLSSAVERKGRAPISGEILRVKIPLPFETRLDNGLTVLVLEDHRFPIVNVQLSISGAGSIYDPAELPGLAGVTAQMLSEGTTTRSSRDIAEQVAALGASLSSTSGFGSTAATITASGLSDTFEQWFAVVTDVLLHPTFPADELNGLKQRLRSQLAQQRSSTSFLISERFNAAVYGSHAAGIRAPSIRAMDAMTPEVLRKWRNGRYSPENAILGIAGDVQAAEVVRAVKKHLAAWQPAGPTEDFPADPAPVAQRNVAVVDGPNSQQTSLMVGNIAVNRRSPDLVPVLVSNQIFGGNAAGRLFVSLREQKGYTYGAYSSVTALKYAGPWRASTDVRNEVAAPALQSIIDEIQRLQKERIPEPELAAARRSMAAGFALSLEDPNELLNYLIVSRVYGYSRDYWDKYPSRIMAVTADDVQRVTQKYLNPDRLQIVAVGDAKRILPALRKFGPIQIYDTEGKVIKSH